MALKIESLNFETRMPKLPYVVPVVRVAAPDYGAREQGMVALMEKLELREVREVHTEFGRAIVSPRGEVEYFHSSGAVWSTNLAASEDQDSEMRDWGDLEEFKMPDGTLQLTLGREGTAEAAAMAREITEMASFDISHAGEPVLDLQHYLSGVH